MIWVSYIYILTTESFPLLFIFHVDIYVYILDSNLYSQQQYEEYEYIYISNASGSQMEW